MVVMSMMAWAMVLVRMRGLLSSAKDPGTQEVYAEPERRDQDRIVEADRNRVDEATQRFVTDQERDYGEDQRARVASELAEFAGAKREPGVVNVAARVPVGEARYRERAGVRQHVPAVGDERHGTVDHAAHDLGHHHGRGQRDDEPGAPLVLGVRAAEEIMRMGAFCA